MVLPPVLDLGGIIADLNRKMFQTALNGWFSYSNGFRGEGEMHFLPYTPGEPHRVKKASPCGDAYFFAKERLKVV
jgi:hypothetical protein